MPPGRKSTAHFGHGERFYRDAAVGTDRLFHNTVRLFRTFGQHLGFLLQTQEAKHTKHQTDQSHYQVNNPHGVLLLQREPAVRSSSTHINRRASLFTI